MSEQKSVHTVEFARSDFVQLHDLSTNDLNGKIGMIESFDTNSNRYIVIVNGINRIKIKPTNLNPFTVYKPAKIENKGMGMVTTCDIKPGTVIFQENMLFGFKKNEPFSLQSIVTKFNNLSKEQQTKFLTLSHHGDEKHSEAEIIQQIYVNNRVQNEKCVSDNSYEEGILLNWSLMNHSCIPNAFSFFDQDDGNWNQVVIALKDIAKNEEILINYLGSFFSFEERRRKLFKTWKFQCMCKVCGKDEQFQKVLDAVYKNYNNLEASLRTNNDMSTAQKVKICLELIKMLNGKLMIDEPRIILSKLYLYLAQFYIQLKEWDNAVIYIIQSIENDLIYYNQFMDWTDTNFVIKSISNKYMKQYANAKFNNWSHVKGLKIPFLSDRDKKKTNKRKKKRRK